MMQGWTCESHLWIIFIGQSDIVKVFIFVSLPNEVFVHLVTHSIVGKSDFESGILFLGGIFSDFPEYFFEFSRVYFRNLLENFSGFWVFFQIFHLRIIGDIFLGLTSIFPDLRYYSEFHFSIFTDSKYFSKLSRSIFPDFEYFSWFSKVFFRILAIFPNFEYFSGFSRVLFWIFSIFPELSTNIKWGLLFFRSYRYFSGFAKYFSGFWVFSRIPKFFS